MEATSFMSASPLYSMLPSGCFSCHLTIRLIFDDLKPISLKMDIDQEQPPTSIDEPIFSRKSLLPILGFAAAIATGLYCAGPAYPSYILPNRVTSQTPQSLDSWLDQERPIALQGILDNTGPTGSKATGAKAGIIVASPSTSDPDYFYTWTRDSALTIETLVGEFTASKSPELERIIQDYISAQVVLQGVENPSGGLCSGGLGEAKFTVNQTAFTGDWGRPQRDGPALRAIALSAYARHLMSEGKNKTVSSMIWPIVQNDLSYVTQYWNLTTFDLWEEVKGASFFTTAMQYRALVQGSKLAHNLGQSCDHCVSQAPQILCLLQSYWNRGYILSNTYTSRSGKDLNSILTSTHMFDPEAGCDSVTFQPCSDKALANHKAVTDSFRPIYAINKNIPTGVGVAVGRYSEDVYMGGNPWYVVFQQRNRGHC